MDKKSIAILQSAYEAEIGGALNSHYGLLQTKSKIAQKLADEGYLEKVSFKVGGSIPMTVEGYKLTLLGNITVCMSYQDPA